MNASQTKMGRPLKDKKTKQSKRTCVWLTESEHAWLKDYCDKKNVSVSELLREYVISLMK